MSGQIFPIHNFSKYKKAGPTDLIELLPAPGCNSLFIQKWCLETFFYGIVHHELIHLSGPTGSAKTSLIEALYLVPENFRALCRALDVPEKPLRVYPIEMVTFDTPGELIQRRALTQGTTFDEQSALVDALIDAQRTNGQFYLAIWLREIGRVHSASIQGGLLNLMTRSEAILPGGLRIETGKLAWIADSNYQAEGDSTHTLVTFDDALKRRFTVNLTLDYPSSEQEVLILKHLVRQDQLPKVDDELIEKVVKLGQVIRNHRGEGNLLTIAPPTIYGYMALIRMAYSLPHLSLQQVARATLLGNAGQEDQKFVAGVFNEVFGIQADPDEDPAAAGNLF